MKHTVEVMIPEAEIKARIAELGRQITERYKDSGSDMVLVGLLRGSFMFMADLCREVQVSHEVDFMTACPQPVMCKPYTIWMNISVARTC